MIEFDPSIVVAMNIYGFIGIAVFAITGVLAGARKGMDIFGIVVIGIVTALGGGTLRDIILNVPVFWANNLIALLIAILASIIAFFLADKLRHTSTTLLQLDALGVAVFNIQAIDKTLLLGYSPAIAVIMGMITGITGGIIRDILTGRPNLLLRREIYATPILAGGIVYVIIIAIIPGVSLYAGILAVAIVLFIRTAAIRWKLTLPGFLLFSGSEEE